MRVSHRDWAQLSAYLDGELSARDIRKLESRLASEPALQAALDDLRTTKQILSRTPRLKVPRNFTLTPQQAGIQPARTAAVGYSWAAALLSFLFIAVMVVDLGSGALKGSLPAAMAPRSEEALSEAVMEEAPAVESFDEPAMLAAAEESAESQNAADQEAEMAQEAAAPAAEEQVSGEVGTAEEENIPEEFTQDQAEGQAKTAPEEADWTGEPGAEIGESQEADGLEGTAPAPEAQAELERASEMPAEEIPADGIQQAVPWIRVLEIILGLGAAGFASAAWIRRRRKS